MSGIIGLSGLSNLFGGQDFESLLKELASAALDQSTRKISIDEGKNNKLLAEYERKLTERALTDSVSVGIHQTKMRLVHEAITKVNEFLLKAREASPESFPALDPVGVVGVLDFFKLYNPEDLQLVLKGFDKHIELTSQNTGRNQGLQAVSIREKIPPEEIRIESAKPDKKLRMN